MPTTGLTTEWQLFLITLLVYANALNCGFCFDDISAIVDNKDLKPHTPWSNLFWHDFWGTPMSREQSHKSYRPLCVLTFRLNYLVHGLQPWGYHLTNIVLHAGVCILYFKVLKKAALASSRVATISGYLFAVHPVHTEAVTGVVGRAELLSSWFFLLTLLLYQKSCKSYKGSFSHIALALAMVSVSCAMLCKEQGITVLGILVIYEVFVVQKFSLKRITAFKVDLAFILRMLTVLTTGLLLLGFR